MSAQFTFSQCSSAIHDGKITAGQIVVHDRARVESEVLPKYFNHSSFASLRRQLNYFAFVRVGKSRQRGAIYSNESVVNLQDILRLKRRVVGSNYNVSEPNGDHRSDKLDHESMSPKPLNLNVFPKISFIQADSLQNIGLLNVFSDKITLAPTTNVDSQQLSFGQPNKRSLPYGNEEKKSDDYSMSPKIHLPLRKKIKFSYELSVRQSNDSENASSNLDHNIQNSPITISEFNNSGMNRSPSVVSESSFIKTEEGNIFVRPAQTHQQIQATPSQQMTTFQTTSNIIPATQQDFSSNFGSHYKQKDEDILAGCNALLALGCNSGGMYHAPSVSVNL